MTDSEIIIQSLQRVERRLRGNRLRRDLSWCLAMFLLFPLALKVWDLFFPFTRFTVTALVSVWFVALAGYSAALLRKKGTLAQAAASVDERVALKDELKTAYWFIDNPRVSDWVDVQIQRAAKKAQKLDVNRLYPSAIPSTVYLAGGMLLLLIGLNFIPSSQNHNWFALEAASQSGVGQDLDLPSINAALQEIARDLERSRELKKAAQALSNRNLPQTATEFREVAEKTGTTSPEALEEIQQSLKEASEHSRPGLEQLSADLKQAAADLQQHDEYNAKQDLERVAQDLEVLAGKIEDQLIRNETRHLRDPAQTAPGDPGGDAQEIRQGAGWLSPLPDTRMPAINAPPGNEPFGLEPSGDATPNPPRIGPPTTLKVQLQLEKLTGQYSKGKQKDLEEASKEERSKIDYRDVPSDLRPAQKDVLNQDSIPGKYRSVIRNYFEAIRPQE